MKFWDRFYRLVLHIPHGLVSGWLLTSLPLEGYVRCCASFTYTAIFVFYEDNEDHHIKDQAWVDLVGWMPGYIFWMFLYWLRNG